VDSQGLIPGTGALKEVFLSKHWRKGKSRGKWDDGTVIDGSRHRGFCGGLKEGKITRLQGATPEQSEKKTWLSSTASRPAVVPKQCPIQLIPGALSPGVKQQGYEDDHSPPSSAEFENGKLYLHSHTCLHGVVLIYLSTGTILHLPNIHKMIWNHWCEF
jgi:hypothetical protein